MNGPLLANYLGGAPVFGSGAGTPLFDPVLGGEVVRVDASGVDLAAGFHFARESGGRALRASTYRERAGLLEAVASVLQANRDAYYDISCANSGTVRNDSAVDIDGAIYTLGQFGRWGKALGDVRWLRDGEAVKIGGKELPFQSQHIQVPTAGLALFINAFNFPGWGLWEKAAPALLSGVPVVVKPATPTAWLTQRMVQDVVEAGVLPPGALSIVCGSAKGLLDQLDFADVVSFTGSAQTGAVVRSHEAIVRRSVRVNIEADSLNSAVLLPDAVPGSAGFEALVREVVREMTVKSGQKCTAIRRVMVPAAMFDAAAEAIGARLAGVTVGNPRNASVRMGSLVGREQWQDVRNGIERLAASAQVLHDGRDIPLIDADAGIAACIGPVLLGVREPTAATDVHDLEVFGPVATLMPYTDAANAVALVRRGRGSLVASLFGADDAALAAMAVDLASTHGRIHVVSPDVAASHTGHGNVMPQSLHGGPGRAGGGEELGGLRALGFYHRRCAIQAASGVVDRLGPTAV